jgi:hypothetical protein
MKIGQTVFAKAHYGMWLYPAISKDLRRDVGLAPSLKGHTSTLPVLNKSV